MINNDREKVVSSSERTAIDFQRKFIQDAIERFGSQTRLASALCVGQQTISKYKDGSNMLGTSKLIKIGRLIGLDEIIIRCN